MLETIKITRVHDLARDEGVLSSQIIKLMRGLGYVVKSPSSRLELQPIEKAALVAVIRQQGFRWNLKASQRDAFRSRNV